MGVSEPRGGEFRGSNAELSATGIGAQIRYVRAVHIVTAQDAGIDPKRQALVHLLECRL
jgi:hypothetical protein